MAIPVALDVLQELGMDDLGSAQVEEAFEAYSQSNNGAKQDGIHDYAASAKEV
jgi:hypothetical protein